MLAGCGGPRQISDSGAGAYEASLTTTANGFAVAWYDTRDGQANNPTSSLIPAVRSGGTGFALAWNEHEPGADSAHGASGKSEIAFALANN